MKRRYDVFYVVILLLFLVIANFIGNAIIKGVLLLLFSLGLIWNTAMKLQEKIKAKQRSRIFYWILLLGDVILAIAAVAVIILAALEG